MAPKPYVPRTVYPVKSHRLSRVILSPPTVYPPNSYPATAYPAPCIAPVLTVYPVGIDGFLTTDGILSSATIV